MSTSAKTALGRWARWVRFLDRREPGTSLALFRIAAGLVVVGAIGSVVLHGLVPSVWFGRADGGILPDVDSNWLFRLLGGATPANIWAMTLTALASGALLALGFGGRLTAFVALQSYLAVTNLNQLSTAGDDRLLGNALWLLVLARSTATLSLDCRLRSGRWRSGELVPAWPRYLAIFQLVLVYWATGVQKVGAEWVPGGDCSALYYILQQPVWVRWDMSWLAWVYPLTQAATAVAWLFEVSSPLLLLALWYRATSERRGRLRALFNWIGFRRVFVAAGLTMHVSLFVLMNVEPFSSVTLSFYCCLYRPEEWQALGRRLFGAGPAAAVPALAPPSRWWPHARASLVTLHLVAIVLLGLPGPPASASYRSTWKNEAVQHQMAAWAGRLSGWFGEITPQELEEFLFGVSSEWVRIQQVAVRPIQLYRIFCGTDQSWGMFTAPHRRASRLHIDVRERGVWRAVHVNRNPDRAWLDGWLSHHRLRPALLDFGKDPDGVPYFAAWVAEQAARDFPTADAVRVRFCQVQIPSPEEMRAGRQPEGKFIHSVELPLR